MNRERLTLIIAGLLLIPTLWLIGELAWTVRMSRHKTDEIAKDYTENMKPAINKAIKNLSDVSDKFNNEVLTKERLDKYDKYLTSQAAAALATSDNARKVANNLNELIKNDIRPTIQDLHSDLTMEMNNINALTLEAQRQLQNNGNEFNSILKESKVTIVSTREQVIKELEELTQATHGLTLITNDPQLVELISNSNHATSNLADSLGHIEVITGDLAGFSAKYVRPRYVKTKRTKLQSFGNGVVTVLRYSQGLANLFYVSSKF